MPNLEPFESWLKTDINRFTRKQIDEVKSSLGFLAEKYQINMRSSFIRLWQ